MEKIEVNEENLVDKRNEIAENIFIELDIVTKSYAQNYGDDMIYNELQFVQSNFAFLLRSHKNEHTLYNIDVDKIEIPNSKYVDSNNNPVTMIYNLSKLDKITYYVNLLINSKIGIHELEKSGYFKDVHEESMLMPTERIIMFIQMKLDEILLRMNVILNKL